MTKYQVGQFPNLERHLSLFQPFSCCVAFFSFFCHTFFLPRSLSHTFYSHSISFFLSPIFLSFVFLNYLPSSNFLSLSTSTLFLRSLAFHLSPYVFLSFISLSITSSLYLFPPSHSCLLTSPFLDSTTE